MGRIIRGILGLVLLGLVSSVFALDTDLSETPEIQFSSPAAQELTDKATELGTAVKIYEYVRNNTEYALYHGSRSGSINSFLGGRGNDVDLASVLIAMLRSQDINIRSRYVVGNIQVAAADVTNWLAVKDLDLAVSIMGSQGIQNVTLAADRSYVEFEHVWVEALVSFVNYRSAGPDSAVDCSVTPTNCHWIPLDPSFKLRTFHNQNIDIYDLVNFDYTSYYNAVQTNDAKFKDKNPLEIYEEQILDYLQQNMPGKTLEDVADPGSIIREEHGILPASLPYKVVAGTTTTYNAVADHDAVGPKTWAKFATLRIIFKANGVQSSSTSPPVLLSDLATKQLSFSIESGSTSVRMVMRLDGNEIWVPLSGDFFFYLNNVLVDIGFPFSAVIKIDGAPSTTGGTDNVLSATYDDLVIGGYYLIATGGDVSNWSQVHRAAGQLLAANEQYPIVNDGAGVPYVDSNGNGAIDAGEVRLLDDSIAQDALTGGLLYSAMSLYFARFRENIERLDNLNHVITPIEGFVGLMSTVYDVEYLDDTAFSVMPGGLLIDMKNQSFNGAWRTDAPAQLANNHFDLFSHSMSSLEHEIWQEITGFDAISTVRGIQVAVGNGATLVDVKKNATENTLPSAYTAFGFTTQAPSPFVLNNPNVFTTKPATWFNPSNNQSFDIFKSDVDLSTPQFRMALLTNTFSSSTTGPYGAVDCVDSQETELNDLIAQVGGNTIIDPPGYTFCDGSVFNGTVSDALSQLQALYLNTIIPTDIGQSYMDFFDENQGFVSTEYVYRDINVSNLYQNAAFIHFIRDDVSTAAPGDWVEYIMPSRKTIAAQNRFIVYILKSFDSTTSVFGQLFAIQNDGFSGGGGYVDGTETLLQSADTSGTVFNNEVFTDQNLNSQVNNDLIVTPSTVDPVSTVTGNMYHDETDLTIKGRGLNIAFTRTYNSGTTTTTSATGIPLSKGWTHSYNMRLVANDYGQFPNYDAVLKPENTNGTTSSITYINERGGELNYLTDDVGATWAVTAPQGVFDTLQLDVPAVGSYTLTFRNGVKYIFQGSDLKVPGNSARLTRIEDPYGAQLLFNYTGNNLTSITDNLGIAGRTGLTLTYNAGNRLQTLSDWTGRSWQYGYDANGRLVSMTNPLNDIITYTYQPGTGYLKDITLPENRGGQPVTTTFSYYRNGKAFDYINTLGEVETLDYDLYRKRTRVTDPRGFVREHFYDQNGALTKLTEPDKAILLFDNTVEGQRYSKTDGLGYQTQYSYQLNRSISTAASDSAGNVTREQDALNNTVDMNYGIFDQITTVTDKRGNLRTNVYYTAPGGGAVAGKLQEVRATVNGIANVRLASFTYYPNGTLQQQIEFLDPAVPTRQRITDYSYDPSGLNLLQVTVTGATGGGSITTTFTYDSLGRKATETLTRVTSAPTRPRCH